LRDEPNSGDGSEGNRLSGCASPYLRQHAFDAVDWYPWGPEAFDRARLEDRPILLSIGYSACHWCHVMARECFDDPRIAHLMNELFVNVKVDRQERPDLDQVYMRAVQAMTGSAGWPLTVFLTPELLPFYGGTYFPPHDQGDSPGFARVLQAVREAYDTQRDEVQHAVKELLDVMAEQRPAPEEPRMVSEDLLEAALKSFAAQFDLAEGGFGMESKFAQTPALDWLLRLWSTFGDPRPRFMLAMTLDHMAAGGVFDQIGGGFHRYAVDRTWRVPHFEKMLYDNGQLAGLYADSYRAMGRQEHLRTAAATAEYMLRELRTPQGAFHAAQDADTPEGEGTYYAWTYEEFTEGLDPDAARLAAEHFGVTREGNWHGGRSIPYQAVPLGALSGIDEQEARAIVGRVVVRLQERRAERTRPETDRMVLADWNALAASGLTKVFRATGDTRFLEAAQEALGFVRQAVQWEGRPGHAWWEGRATGPAYLADIAGLGTAMLDLYECTLDVRHLRRARGLAGLIVAELWDPERCRFRDNAWRLPTASEPSPDSSDEPVPSGPSAACQLLLRLGYLGSNDRYVEVAGHVLAGAADLMWNRPLSQGHMLSAALRHLSAKQELVIVEPPDGSLRRAVDRFYLPHLVVVGARPSEADRLATEVPMLVGKGGPSDGAGTAYLCCDRACRDPVHTPEDLQEQLRPLLPGT
jgi:uncharacterized protein YyaL (SSP411 family)